MRDKEQNCPHCEMPIAFEEDGGVWFRNHQAMECVSEMKRVRDNLRAAHAATQKDHINLTDKYEDALRMIVGLEEKLKCPTTNAPSAESVATASSEQHQVIPVNTQSDLSADIARTMTILRQTSAPSA